MFKEGQESDIYRDNLFEEIKEAPKEERQEILDIAKETPEYQIARNKKIEGRQNEEEINDGEGVFLKKKTLYHGSATKGIDKFKEAVESTVGDGLYLTSQAKDAIGYAMQRIGSTPYGKSEINPTVYETSLENVSLVDLRKDENVRNIMQRFKNVLQQRIDAILAIAETKKVIPHNLYSERKLLKEAIALIDSGKIGAGNVVDASGHFPKTFSDYIASQGYDGLITFEGGEGQIGNHDSYVIFDPEKVKIIREQKIRKEEKDK